MIILNMVASGGAIWFQSAENETYFDKIITVKNSIFSGNYTYNYENTDGGCYLFPCDRLN